MIRMEHLSKRFGNVVAVDDLTLEIPAGELFCFLGPNGAGKTTTIKMLTGLVRPAAGRAWIGGHDMQAEPLAAKQMIGYIPDMPYLYDRLTVAEFFDFSGELYGMPTATIRAREEELFDTFGLLNSRAVLVKDLSHGMRQRLLYASTLLRDPPVLFIDEPLIGLDPYTIRSIKAILKGRALVDEIADRIGVIHQGRLAALGTLPELLASHHAKGLEELFISTTGGWVE